MDILSDSKKFFRYFIPGSVIILENIIIWILYKANFKFEGIKEILKSIGKSNWVELIVLYVIGALSLGFLISLVYHGICWATPLRKYFMVNHSSLINKLVANNKIELVHNHNSTPIINQQGAWRIATAIWFGRRGEIKSFGSVGERTKDLSDIIGSLGTVYIGSLISYIVYLFFGLPTNNCQTFMCLLVLWSALLILIHQNFIQTIYHTQRTIDIVMYEALSEDTVQPSPYKVLVTNKDFDR
jgi:hypothetical protein